jgi:RHS repeat-associated protein
MAISRNGRNASRFLASFVVASLILPSAAYGLTTSGSATHTSALPSVPAKKSAPTRLGIPRDTRIKTLSHTAISPSGLICAQGAVLPPVSQNTLAWVAVSSANEVEMVNETTGAVYGSPIALPTGSNPTSIAYWQPSPGSSVTSSDPIVVTANSNDSVSFIDTVTKQVLSTLSLGSGSNPSSIAVSPTTDFAVVSDTLLGNARVQMISMKTRTVVKSFATVAGGTNVISQVIFDPSGYWVDAAAPNLHKIFAFEQTSSSSPYFTQPTGSTYTGSSSFNPTGLAADETNSSATSLFVTSNGSSTTLSTFTNDPPSSPTTTFTFSGGAPTRIAISPGAVDAYVEIPSLNKVDVVTLSGTVTSTPYTTTAKPGALAVNAGSGTLYVADTSSGATDTKLYNWTGTTPSLTLQNTAILDGVASSIANPVPQYIHYDVFAATANGIEVIDSGTGNVVQFISDANDPVSAVPSPDGRLLYVVNAYGSGTGGLSPEVQVISTVALGTSNAPITHTYPIPQGSLPNIPYPAQAALSPSGDDLVITDWANSDVLNLDVGPFDSSVGSVTGISSLNGSTSESPESITFAPDGSNAYVSVQPSAGGTGGLTTLTYGSGVYASPTYQDGSTLSDSAGHHLQYPGTIVASSDGRSLYVLDTNASAPYIFQFPRTTSGTLSNETLTALPAGTTPVSMSLSPEDAVAYVTDSTTDVTSAVNLSTGNAVYSSVADKVPGVTSSTPDGQYFVSADNWQYTDTCTHTGIRGLSIYSSADGSLIANVNFGFTPTSIVVSPVSSSVTEASTLAFQGQQSWTEMLGGANPSESAVSSLVDVQSGGTPADAPGVSAGTNTNLRSYELSLDAMTIPSVGLPLNVTASYDSERITNGMDTSSSPAAFANGWRLSTGVTFTQNPTSGLFPCEISVTQDNGSIVNFEPSTVGPYSTCPTANYEAPPWAQATLSVATNCSGTDSCWVVTNETSGVATYIDLTASTHQLVKEVDRNGNTVSFTYTSGALSSESESGRSLTFSYPSPGTATCSTSFNSQSVARCMVVTDPIGRTATFFLAGTSGTGYNLIGETLAPTSGSGAASYAFSYSGNYLTSWWTPQNFATYGNSTTEATDITYSSILDWVTQVSAPQVTNQGTDMSDTYTPTWTFSYPVQDLFSGTGVVVVSDADTNWNAAHTSSTPLSGANVTLDYFVDFGLAAQVQGYGPAENSNPLAVTSETATTLRDPLTLLPDETINPLADTGTGTLFNAGTTFYTYDALGNLMATTSPGPTSGTWSTTSTQFNSFDEPLSSTDALGNVTTYTYDSKGNTLTTTSPSTNSWTAAPETSSYYNSNGTVCASRDANEVAVYGVLTTCSATHATTYSYDSAGDQTSTSDPLGDVSSSYFDADGNQCASLTPDAYAAGARLTSCPSSAQSNEIVVLSRNVYNDVTSSATPSNAAGGTSYSYFNLNNDPISSVSVLGNPATCNPLTSSTCLDTSYDSYNADGELTSNVAPTTTSGVMGATTTSFFDPDGHAVASVTPAGNVAGAAPSNFEQVMVSNSLGSNIASTPESNLSASCSIASATSLCPNTSLSQVDAAGDVTATYLPNSSGSGTIASSSVYDPTGRVSSETSLTGTSSSETTTNTYDQSGRLLTTTTTGSGGSGTTTTGSATAYEPNGATCWTSPLPWAGSTAPSCSNPPLGTGNETTVNYYDQDGNLVAVAGPGSNPYSPLNTSGCNPITTSTCSFVTYYGFNQASQQVTATTPTDAAGNSPVTTTYYDASGNAVAITKPGGNPSTCNPLTTSTCADTIYQSFDAEGRLVGKSYTDGTPNVTYSFNNDGTPATMVDGTGTTTYGYNSAGKSTSVTNGAGAVVTWGYNGSGQLICQSYPNSSGSTCSTSGAGTSSPPNGDVTYTYDSLGRLSSIITWTGVTLTNAYDCDGGLGWISTGTASTTSCSASSLSDPAIPTSSTAITTSYTTDPSSGALTSQVTTASGGTTNLLSFGFGRDSLGRLTSSTPTLSTTTKNTDGFSYDSSNRVATGPITGTTGSNSYGYTPSGGITADTTNFVSAAYAPNGELCWTSTKTVTSPTCSTPPTGATTYSYDSNGDRTNVNGTTETEALVWTKSSERLVCVNTSGATCSVTSPSSTTTLYSYDGNGLRTASTNQGATTHFTWDPTSSTMLADSNKDYIYEPGSSIPIAQIGITFATTPTVDLLVCDTNLNTRGVVQIQGDSSTLNGTLVNYTDYDAYGNPITEAGGAANSGGLSNYGVESATSSSFGFGASYQDQSLLNYLINRYLDAASGQFLSVDPQIQDTQNPFLYAGDSPPQFADPFGLHDCNWDPLSWGGCVANVATSAWNFTADVVSHVGHWISEHRRSLIQFGIGLATVIGTSLCTVCSLMVATILIGATASVASYAASCLGIKGKDGCTATGAIEAGVVGAASGALGNYLGSLCKSYCETMKNIKLSGINIASNAVVGTVDLVVGGVVKKQTINLGAYVGVGLGSLSGATFSKNKAVDWKDKFLNLLKNAVSEDK